MLIKDIDEGKQISFRSKDPADLTEWKGTLESKGTYRSIRSWGNPKAQNEAVRQTDPSVSSDETSLSYFLITLDNNSEKPVLKVFASEWIEEGSLIVLSPGNKVTIEIDDPKNDTRTLLSLLANQGYACTIIPNR